MDATDLIAKARQFDQLDRKCIRLSYEGVKPTDETFVEYFSELLGLCSSAYLLWNEIKLELGEVSILQIVDPDARKIVRKIRDDYDFLVIRQYVTIARILNTSIDDINEQHPTDFGDFVQERFDDLFSEFHSWFDIGTYYRRKAQIGCIVVALPHDRTIDQYYSEIREAYAFTCYRACVALCRAVIELVLYDTLKKRKLLKNVGEIDIETGRKREFHLGRLIVQAAKYPAGNPIIGEADIERAWRIKDKAERILHFRDRSGGDELDVPEDEAFDLIKDTIAIVEAAISR